MNDTIQLEIVDQLDHPHFSWPDSMVRFDLPEHALSGSVFATDETGADFPAQLLQKDGKLQAAIVTNLPSGEKRRFTLKKGQKEFAHGVKCTHDATGIHVDNGLLQLHVFTAKQPDAALFELRTSSGTAARAVLCNVPPVRSVNAVLRESGPVFADICVAVVFDETRHYEVDLQVTQSMDYVGLQERMTGFRKSDHADMKIVWTGFQPEYRICPYRGREPIDAYLQEDHRIPMQVMPFDSWVSWWTDKYISFEDVSIGQSAGLFVHHAEIWDDGEYAIWRSSSTMAVRFFWQNEQLIWAYPLANGTRGTAIALFSPELDRGYAMKERGDGLYGQNPNSPFRYPHIQQTWFWQEWLSLDKVHRWTLRWTEDQEVFPRFFRAQDFPKEGTDVWYLGFCNKPFTPSQMEKIVFELSHSMNQMIRCGAVSNREFYDWVVVFDMAAPHMTPAQYDRLRASFAFCAYAFSDECYMPVRHMLAGHPNFLADARGVAAVAAALFPNHPDARKWKNEYELAMARNLKYHTRPEVKMWKSLGGRWTENLGCYTFAMLRPACFAQTLLERTYCEHVLLYPNLCALWRHVIHTLSAPVNGNREVLPIGAHCRRPVLPSYQFDLWADSLQCYAPLLAEEIRSVVRLDVPTFEESGEGKSLYRSFFNQMYPGSTGTRMELKSEKYTGFGFVMRAAVGTPDEMCVSLTQIDEGPNYRWGLAGNGSCGMLLYYAHNSRYSNHDAEAAGDGEYGDVQACSNFGVLRDHSYRAVGRNDLTEPLIDFGFAQFAQVNGSPDMQPYYHSRSVLMSGCDYIVVLDAVADRQTFGCFSWFNRTEDPFPTIVQLKPGVGYTETHGGIPLDSAHEKENPDFIGRYYAGSGDFLTLVSHRPFNKDYTSYTTVTDYGVLVELEGRTDYVFRKSSRIRYTDSQMEFDGTAGIVRIYGNTRAEAALFHGRCISVFGISLRNTNTTDASLCFSLDHGELSGWVDAVSPTTVILQVPERMVHSKLYVKGQPAADSSDGTTIVFSVPAGKTKWEWTDKRPVPATPIIQNVRTIGPFTSEISWSAAVGAEYYRIEASADMGKHWTKLDETTDCKWVLSGHSEQKVHIRVCGINSDRPGDFCWDYPIYLTAKTPRPVDGLRVWKQENGYRISWGDQLGVTGYRLYRRCTGTTEFAKIYDGTAHSFFDQTDLDSFEYVVSAVNGNGEGACSVVRSTHENGLEQWDPQPEVPFRRYLPSHEYGYHRFDFRETYSDQSEPVYPE